MKKLFSLILALTLCLGLCGFAAAEAAEAETEAGGLEAFMAMMQQIPELADIDWVAFAEEFSAKKSSGAEITLEDCLPAEAWAVAGSLMIMGGNGESGEDAGYDVDVQVNGNDMVAVYKLKEQVDEEAVKQIADSVAASFESAESLVNMKSSFESMAGANIDITKVAMTLRFLNADDSVIYDKTLTYDDVKDLEAVPAE